jgi:hypothetical protein
MGSMQRLKPPPGDRSRHKAPMPEERRAEQPFV